MKKPMMLTLAALAMLGLSAAPAAAQTLSRCGDPAHLHSHGQKTSDCAETYHSSPVYPSPGPIANWQPGPGPEPGMGYKFGRGVVNVLTFWTEIPRNVALEWQRTDPASGFFLGVGKGAGYGYARLMGGLYDMVSFAFPVPMGFAPVMHPEFSAHNEYRELATGRELIQPLHVTHGDYRDDYHGDHYVAVDHAVRPTRQWP